MKEIKGALGPAVATFVATMPVLGFAQSNGTAQDVTSPVAGASTAVTLAPAEIVTEVQRAGFDPISGPVQRGRVYVLFALDRNERDVKLTVDAGSGRVLWVTGIAGTRYGGPGYYGYRAWWRYDRPPVPPAAIPNTGPGWNNFGPVTRDSSIRPFPPLPRTRPAGPASAVAKDTAPPSPYPSPQAREGREGGEPKMAAPSRSDVAPTATLAPAQPAMVPVAPLE